MAELSTTISRTTSVGQDSNSIKKRKTEIKATEVKTLKLLNLTFKRNCRTPYIVPKI